MQSDPRAALEEGLRSALAKVNDLSSLSPAPPAVIPPPPTHQVSALQEAFVESPDVLTEQFPGMMGDVLSSLAAAHELAGAVKAEVPEEILRQARHACVRLPVSGS